MKVLIAFACSFLFLAQARAETEIVFTHLPTPIQIEGYQCGYVPVVYSPIGFSADGNYVVSQVYATTSCSGGGRGTHPTTHSGCAAATWDLSGYLVSVVRVECGTVAVYAGAQGYEVILQRAIPYGAYPTPVLVMP
jgi:hypothetical protein